MHNNVSLASYTFPKTKWNITGEKKTKLLTIYSFYKLLPTLHSELPKDFNVQIRG